LAGFTVIAVVWAKIAAIRLAILQALARHGTKNFKAPVPGSCLAHLLLNGFRQNLHQRSRRVPIHAAIEPARQLIES